MGWLDENDDWVSGDRDAAGKQLRETAKAYMAEGADRVDRPVEQATAGKSGDDTSQAARKVLELGRHGGDIDHISTLLAIKRAAAGEQTDPAAIANQNRKAVSELADDFDDTVEANHAHEDGEDREDFYAWLLDEHNLTEHDLALHLEQLNEQDQDKTLVMLGDLYHEASGSDETDDEDDYEYDAAADDAEYGDDDTGDTSTDQFDASAYNGDVQ